MIFKLTINSRQLFFLFVFGLFLIGCSGGGSDSTPNDSASDSNDNDSPPSLFKNVASDANLVYSSSSGEAFGSNRNDYLRIIQSHLGSGAAVGDYDNDGDLDIYLLAPKGEANRLYQNNLKQGSKTFTRVNQDVLEDVDSFSRVAHFVDLDNDGQLDILLVNDEDSAENSASKIFKNNGDGSFTDVTVDSGFNPMGYFRAGCALADYDLDGLIDIYVTNWTNVNEFAINRLYRNLGDFKFEDVTLEKGLDYLGRDSFTAIFKDFNDDNYPDIYVAIDHSSDEFYVNHNGMFSRQTDETGANHIANDMGVAAADWDDDGDLDIYTTNITDPSNYFGTLMGTNAFYINQLSETGELTFVDKAAELGVNDTHWGWGTEFIDIENDGDLDLVSVTGFDYYVNQEVGDTSPVYRTPSILFRNDNGIFNKIVERGLSREDDSRTLIAFDYDRDGDEDLLIVNVDQRLSLLENISTDQGHWLHLVLKPDNKAIGATVYAEINGVTKRRDIIAGRSYLAGTPSEVHFGLGDATQVDRLTIRWADGTEQVFNNIAADQLIEYDY